MIRRTGESTLTASTAAHPMDKAKLMPSADGKAKNDRDSHAIESSRLDERNQQEQAQHIAAVLGL
jgi:hypothetical protein